MAVPERSPDSMRPPRPGRATLPALALLAGLGLAGCSGSASSPPLLAGPAPASSPLAGTPAASSPAGGTTEAGGGDTQPPTPPAAGASTTPGAVPACDTTGLRIAAGRVDAGAGQRYVPIVLTNRGDVPCTLRGYPGVDALDPAGRQVTQARRAPATVRTITLRPGASASATVHATAVASGSASCPADYAGLLVTPPGTRTSVRLPVTLPACGGLDVRPVVAGVTGT